MQPFVHLHVHTEYSLLDGANPIDRLVQAAVEDGHESLAITDHGNLYGALEFYTACRKAGVKPILGCEIYVAEKSMREPHDRRANGYTHLTLLARDAEGWRNLMDLSTDAHLEGHHFRPRVDMELLAAHARGITCLSGCMSGPVNRRLRSEDEAGARAVAGRLRDVFGAEHFYLEVMRNGIEEQSRLTEGMARMRAQVDSPLVATNDIHYLRHEDCAAQDALICLGTGARVSDPKRWRMSTDTLYFRTREEMNRIFGDLPEALSSTLKVAEAIDVRLETEGLHLPVFSTGEERTPEQLFRDLCEQGFARHYPGATPEARERLEFEMETIHKMGFVSYFLIVWDLVRHARERGIPVGPGRGSAAGSLVAYVLGVTRIDPLRYDLLFERFLNPSRISMPDIDIDFCKDRREEMITYTRQRYGDDRVCQIITFGRLKAKNALRDMGRVLEIPLSEVDKAAKKIPDGPRVSLASTLKQDPDLRVVREASHENTHWFDLALRVEGMARNSGLHPAGVIIADRPVREILPLTRQGEAITTQWDMNACEKIGLLKMDFLGLRTLTILEEGLRLIAARSGERPDLDTLPLDDAATYESLQRADTEGIFQLESDGMRRLLADIRPSVYEDLVAVLALFRPGPLRSGLHENYARRKHGTEVVEYLHPMLEPVLKETYGVLIYQEQIMRVAQRMGGLSLADADSLRKAMGKKIPELMAEFADQFVSGAVERGVDNAVAKQIWEMMVQFAEYGFNKSHSTGYAMVTYQAAWMKVHHPAEFYAASLTFEASNADKLRALIEDARRHGIRVLPPCVNASGRNFAVDDPRTVRFGLEAVKGVGSGAAEALIAARAKLKEARFADTDTVFLESVACNLNKTALEALAKGGAFDSFAIPRLQLVTETEDRLRRAASVAKDRQRGQSLLFGGPVAEVPSAAAPAATAPQDPDDWKPLMQAEKEALGLYLTRHPLDDYRDLIGGLSPWDTRSLAEAGADAIVALAGVVTQLQIRPTRKDPSRKIAKLRIEDLWGSIGAVIFPQALERLGEFLADDRVGLFRGRLSMTQRDEVEMLIDEIAPIGSREELALTGTLEVRLDAVSGNELLTRLQEVLLRHPGAARVRFLFPGADGGHRAVRAGSEWKVRLGPALTEDIGALLGPGRAHAVMDRPVTQKRERPAWTARARNESRG